MIFTEPLSIASDGYLKGVNRILTQPSSIASEGYLVLYEEGRRGGGMNYAEYLRRNPKLYLEEDEEIVILIMGVVQNILE